VGVVPAQQKNVGLVKRSTLEGGGNAWETSRTRGGSQNDPDRKTTNSAGNRGVKECRMMPGRKRRGPGLDRRSSKNEHRKSSLGGRSWPGKMPAKKLPKETNQTPQGSRLCWSKSTPGGHRQNRQLMETGQGGADESWPISLVDGREKGRENGGRAGNPAVKG